MSASAYQQHPLSASFHAAIPSCALCLDTLGRWGGPATLPCGHNACRDCLAPVLARPSPRCPLCRQAISPQLTSVAVNHELRDLVALATMLYLDEREKQEGWEAFPDGEAAARSYKDDVKQHIEEQHRQLVVWGADGAAGETSAVRPQEAVRRGSEADRDVLALEPPQWLPDSFASACGGCHLQFRPLTRLKHHCRMCGKIYCHSCCHKRLLLPPKFSVREPQRVCELCSSLLAPLQPFLAGTQSAAVQPPVHDSIDSVSLRSWLNSPWSSALEGDIYKGANILQTFTRAMRLHSEESLPMAVLQGCRALVLLSSVKVGAGWSCSFGTGLVVARRPAGGWSAPCAVACCGMGWGLQFGGELADLVLVLRSEEQLRALCTGAQLGLGGDVGLAVGLMGRHVDAAVMLGYRGATSPVYSYSCSKGAFLGAALQGTVMMVRGQVNEKFYGYIVSAAQLLMEDTVPQPPAASTLYDALHTLAQKYEMRALLTLAQLQDYTLQYGNLQGQAQGVQAQGQAQAQALASAQAQGQATLRPEGHPSGAASSSGSERSADTAAEADSGGSDTEEMPQQQLPQQQLNAAAASWLGRSGLLAAFSPAAPAPAPAPAPALASAPDWTASGTYLQSPAFMLQPAMPSAPSQTEEPELDLPSAPTTRVAGMAPQLTAGPRPQRQPQPPPPTERQREADDDDVPYGFLFDEM